jgi:hypothetical protein
LTVRKSVTSVMGPMRKANQVKGLIDAAPRVESTANPGQLKVLSHRQRVIEPRRVERHRNGFFASMQLPHFLAKNLAAPPRSWQQAQKGAHAGGLACAIAAEQTIQVTTLDA